jgi:hypothetical protein
MQIYDTFRIISYDQGMGQVEVAWYDTNGGPIRGQTVAMLTHRLPLELETLSMDKAALVAYLLPEAPASVPTIPQWVINEAERTNLRWSPSLSNVV